MSHKISTNFIWYIHVELMIMHIKWLSIFMKQDATGTWQDFNLQSSSAHYVIFANVVKDYEVCTFLPACTCIFVYMLVCLVL